MEEDIYFKQKKLFNPHANNLKVFVYGCGSIGSHTIMALAKIGIKDITAYDYDKVETDNLPAQFFDINSDGFKVDEMARLVEQMTGIEIKRVKEKIDNDFDIDVSFNSIHIIAFDNIEGRKVIYEKLKDFPVHLIDGRIGGFNFEKYYLDCRNDNKAYEKTLEGTFSELECGEKCLWVVNSIIASKIVADVIKLSKNQRPNYLMKGNALSDITISRGEANVSL